MANLQSIVDRVPHISPTSKGPLVNLANWICTVNIVLAVLTVLITKLIVLRKLSWADLVLTSAMLFAIAFMVVLTQQVSHGLGSPLKTLSVSEYESFQAAGYACQFLCITCITLGKISTLSLLLALAPTRKFRLPMQAVAAVVLIWAFCAIIGISFQCEFPKPWLYTSSHCFDQVAFGSAICVVDILTDLAIMGLPMYLVYNLQLAMEKKFAVIFAFSFRSLAVACTIIRITDMPSIFKRGTDVTLNSWVSAIVTVLEVFSTIFAACVPHLRPFMESLQAGYLSGMHTEGEFQYGNDSYLMGKMAKSKVGASTNCSQGAQLPGMHGGELGVPRQFPSHTPSARSSTGLPTSGGVLSNVRFEDDEIGDARDDLRSESVVSSGDHSNRSTGSKAMIIKTIREWSISYLDDE